MTPTKSMPKNFDFAEAETRIYKWWEKNKWFKPEVAPKDAEPFVISIPPPNVTGALHTGHALFSSLVGAPQAQERLLHDAASANPAQADVVDSLASAL